MKKTARFWLLALALALACAFPQVAALAATKAATLPAPKLTKVENAATGVKVTWSEVSGIDKYRVFYKTGGGSWVKAGDTTKTSYTWTKAKNGTKYTFTVRGLSSDNKKYTSAFDTKGKAITYVAAPKLSKVENTATGVKVSWGKVAGAAQYRVFYRTGGGSWTKAGDSATTSYTWAKAKAGTKYTFTVRCLSADKKSYTSGFDTAGKTITYQVPLLATPKLGKVESTETGIKISWGMVSGAAKYRVFYKTGPNSWTKAGDSASTSFIWTKAKNKTEYTLTVRCLSADGKSYTSAFDTKGKTITYKIPMLATPKLTKVENTVDGIKITWGKVAGAAKYRVFYKTGANSWTKVGDSATTSYTWAKAKAGTQYTFTVRCLSADNKAYKSEFDTVGKTITCKTVLLDTPKLAKVENTATGVKISWGKVSGAGRYRVFYKSGPTSWTKVGDSASTSYTWTKAKSGNKYIFTVRCLSADSTRYISNFDTTGKSITYIAAPAITSVQSTDEGVLITWGKVAGAAKYRVFRKTGPASWTKVGDSSTASFTWKKAEDGTQYTFTVRCLSADGKNYTSAYDQDGKTITYKIPNSVDIQTSFPDLNFRNYVSDTFDKNKDGVLSQKEWSDVTKVDVHEMNIVNLDGIQYFTNLTELVCWGNQLFRLDLSRNPALQSLNCIGNRLTALDVSRNPGLVILACGDNYLPSLDLRYNPALAAMSCENNQLTELDLRANTSLNYLECQNNTQLRTLKLHPNMRGGTLLYDRERVTPQYSY